MTMENQQEQQQQEQQQDFGKVIDDLHAEYNTLIARANENTKFYTEKIEQAGTPEEVTRFADEYLNAQEQVLKEASELRNRVQNTHDELMSELKDEDPKAKKDPKAPKAMSIITAVLAKTAADMAAKWKSLPRRDKVIAVTSLAAGAGMLYARERLSKDTLARLGYIAVGTYATRFLNVGLDTIFDV